MYIACKNGHVEVVNILLEQPKIDIYQVDLDGKTPLDIAKENKYYEIVRILEDKIKEKTNLRPEALDESFL